MEPLHKFTSYKKLRDYLRNTWPDSRGYVLLDGKVWLTFEHFTDKRVAVDEYEYLVVAVPAGTQVHLDKREILVDK